MKTRRAGCGESRTSGSEGGPEKPTGGNACTALRSDPYTTIPSLFRLFSFKLVVVLDVFSRIPLAARVFWKDPSAPQMGRLVQRAARRFTPPRHFVSDKGSQFTAKRFRMALRRLGTRQRFGAVGRYGSIAIIEDSGELSKTACDCVRSSR